jgi:hypothetical protein
MEIKLPKGATFEPVKKYYSPEPTHYLLTLEDGTKWSIIDHGLIVRSSMALVGGTTYFEPWMDFWECMNLSTKDDDSIMRADTPQELIDRIVEG